MSRVIIKGKLYDGWDSTAQDLVADIHATQSQHKTAPCEEELELLEAQVEKCKQFLQDNADMLCMTDFSLHSIGVILFRFGKEKDFQKIRLKFPTI